MASLALAQRLKWSSTYEIFTSDHIPILIQFIPRQNSTNQIITTKWYLKSPKWDLYSKQLEKNTENLIGVENQNIEHLMQLLTD